MTVFILERVSASLRGELSRWMIEPKTGVFVGRLSALVRDKLWELIAENLRTGAALLMYHADSEQGFALRTLGDTSRAVIDFDGLSLIRV